MSTLKYRSDIEGLRAIAVIPVVLFHAGFSSLHGGFIGVDVFFVISGYLITSIIIKQLQNNQFSLVEFYERRARRILPALFVMVLATIIVGFFVFFPEQLSNLSKSAIATMTFVPNLYFYSNTGYFTPSALDTPLLHTWSLGVEEQFYIFFPIFIMLCIKILNKSLAFRLTCVAFFMSLFLSICLVYYNKESVTFYMLPTRAWELLAGSILAFGWPSKKLSLLNRNILSVTGAMALCLGYVFIDETLPFPGLAALIPVAGAALIIYSGESGYTLVGALLSNRVLGFVGKISYSLYLWHWPITVYFYYFSDSPFVKYLIVLVSFIMATLSYIFVENYFRNKSILSSTKRLFAHSALAISFICSASIFIVLNDGVGSRFPKNVIEITESEGMLHNNRECHFIDAGDIASGRYCVFGKVDVKPTFALIGDSHADALRPAVEDFVLQKERSAIQLTNAGCRPFLGVYEIGSKNCMEFIEASLNEVLNSENIDYVILHGYWSPPYTGNGYRNKNIKLEKTSFDPTQFGNEELFVYGVKSLVGALVASGRKVIIVGGVPEIGFDLPFDYAKHLVFETPFSASEKVTYDPAKPALIDIANQFAKDEVFFVDLEKHICPDLQCQLIRNGKPIYRDGDHITFEFSKTLGSIFSGVIGANKSGNTDVASDAGS